MPEKEIVFNSKVISSLITEEKKISDSIIITKFSDEASKGLFKRYDSALEDAIFNNKSWGSLSTGQQADEWIMSVSDEKSGKFLAEIKRCLIKDISAKRGQKEEPVITITVQHQKSKGQPALEAAVSTKVLLTLSPDTEVLPGADEAEE